MTNEPESAVDDGTRTGPTDQESSVRLTSLQEIIGETEEEDPSRDDYIARPLAPRESDKERVEVERLCSEACERYAREYFFNAFNDRELRDDLLKAAEDVVGRSRDWLGKVRVYGMIGRMGSGKDFVAKYYLKRYLREVRGERGTCLALAFADGLKRESASKYGFDYESLYHKKTKESRFHCQRLGTEYGRNVYGNNVWVRHLLVEMRTHYEVNDVRLFVVTDVRFANELVTLKFLFGDRFETIQVLSDERHREALKRESGGDPDVEARIEGHVSEKFAMDVHDSWIDHLFVNEPGQDAYEDFVREMWDPDDEVRVHDHVKVDACPLS